MSTDTPDTDEIAPASERHGVDYTIEPQYAETDIHGNELTPEERRKVRNFEMNKDPISHTALNWKSAASRDAWQDLFHQFSAARSTAEWRSVLDEETDRKAAIIHVDNYNREKWLRRLSKMDLVYNDIRFSAPYEGYSHKHIPTTADNPRRHTYAVIAPNEDLVDKMTEASLELSGPEKHKVKGELLGFPDCCQEFFGNVWLADNQIDPMYEAACNTGQAEAVDGDRQTVRIPEPNPGLCPLWRYWGANFVTHMPCSFDCEKSVDIARSRYRIMQEAPDDEVAPQVPDALHQWLTTPFVWEANNGLARISNRHIIGRTHTTAYLKKKKVVWMDEPEPRDVVEDYHDDGEGVSMPPGA